ncbi:hypothetical protein B0I22_2805 [Epilithonimonas xixisoli]|uniref:Uncharacterized protein n=2 Tax=Epilithonimonas xixisoli TaxID=1476462 RepID=A0A4V3H2A5_9FLAO|nr:hypothetical protein B0I22_2805 [Epilithonimonas xixisoli]
MKITLMKTILTFMILLLGFNFNLAQQKKIDSSFTKEKHLKSYKPLMKTANILLASGGGLMLIGGILIATDNSEDNGWITIISGQEFAGVMVIIAGIITASVSIPFYITAYVKKRKLKLSPAITYEYQKNMQIPITNFGLAINF